MNNSGAGLGEWSEPGMKKKQESRRTCSQEWSDKAILAESRREQRGTTYEEDVDTKVSTASPLEENADWRENNGKAGKE